MIQQTWQAFLRQAGGPAAHHVHTSTLAHLPSLTAVRFEGVDAQQFLQGYLTADTDHLAPGRLLPTALCNLKGRVVLSGWATLSGSHAVRLVLHESLTTTLAAALKPYLAFSKTRLVDERATVLVLGGTRLPEDAGALDLDGERALVLCEDVDAAAALWQRCAHQEESHWFAALTRAGVPLLTQAVSERFLPQMLNLDRLGAIDFAKGCYLGQEVVARAQHRGAVKRSLRVLTWQGAAPPAPGLELRDGSGRAAGAVVFAGIDTPGRGPATAVLHNEATAPFHGTSPDGDLRLV